MVRSSKVRREARGDGISTGGEEEQGKRRKKEREMLRREDSMSFASFFHLDHAGNRIEMSVHRSGAMGMAEEPKPHSAERFLKDFELRRPVSK